MGSGPCVAVLSLLSPPPALLALAALSQSCHSHTRGWREGEVRVCRCMNRPPELDGQEAASGPSACRGPTREGGVAASKNVLYKNHGTEG